VSGRLLKIRVRKGEQVRAGQVLAELDPEMADAQVAQAEAAVAAAEAGAAIASDVAGRNAALVKEGDVSDLQSKTSTANAQQAAAQHMVAKASLAQARANRKRHDLKAPFAGTVIDAPDQVGAAVSSVVPLFTLEQIDPLVLKTTVPEEARGLLTVGAKVHVTAVSGRAETDQATIRSVVPSADPATRRIPVEIEVPNQDDHFVAHTLAKADLDLGADQEAQSIPATALASSGGDHVFSIAADGQIHRVPVEVVQRGAQEVLVRAASPLERIVDYPSADLTDGAKVSVK
jgi:RND family efflux transporter MFP subunit